MFKKIFSIITVALFLVTCDGFKTELDIDIAAFPPKLVVTAILDGTNGTFNIVLSEGRALADYKTFRLDGQKNVVNGEILLYEDGNLIFSEVGEFDMTYSKQEPYYDTNTWQWVYPDRGGYRFEASVATNPGSTYQLVVKTDKYETVTSTSIMPILPDVSATINTDEIVRRNGIIEYRSLQGWSSSGSSGDYDFWPVSLQWGKRPVGRNYYALEMFEEITLIEGTANQWTNLGKNIVGICVSDLSKLQDNPEIEFFDTIEIGMDPSSTSYSTYKFPILLMSDISFTLDNASLTLYKLTVNTNDLGEYYPPEYYEKTVYHHSLSLRVRHITEATFRYYRSLALQSVGIDFFTEPVKIVGNIENGYGSFVVYSAADIHLLEYESYEYRMKYW